MTEENVSTEEKQPKKKTAEKAEKTAAAIEEQAKSVFSRILELGNRKYGFNFEVHGWIIAIVTFLLLVLILK